VEWCGQCGARLDVGSIAGSPRAAAPPRWRPPEHTVAPAPAKVYSRWHGGPLSLPPAAKVAITACVWLVAGWMMVFSGSPASGIVMCGTAAWVTRETWKQRRIR